MYFLRLALFLIVVLLVLAVFVPGTVSADSAPMGAQGAGVVPLHNDQVTMVSETVEVWLYPDWA